MNSYSKLVTDSRYACPGCLFFCKGAGFKIDYLQTAIEKGAAAYVSETDYKLSVPCILVKDVRVAMAEYAKEFYSDPSSKLPLIGITGTKGKSTTLYYLKSILENSEVCGQGKFGYTSSIDNFDGKKLEESHLTTPESIELNGILNSMIENGIKIAGMEVSSQALKYHRSLGLYFKLGAFTNFSKDHISPAEHTDEEDYFHSKLRLISQCETFVVNLNGARSEEIVKACIDNQRKNGLPKRIICFDVAYDENEKTYKLPEGFEFVHAGNVHKENGLTCFLLKDINIKLSMPGLFNVENAVLAAILAKELGAKDEEIVSGLFIAKAGGRMEIYKDSKKDITFIVDFAHNKLAFEKIFESVSMEYPEYKKIAVFGCPGNKAEERRTELPAVAAKYADYVYVTEDDPYLEDPEDICKEVYKNLVSFGGKGEIIVDREEAIKTAYSKAKDKTVIMLLAKGQDKYMHRKAFDPYISDPKLAEELCK